MGPERSRMCSCFYHGVAKLSKIKELHFTNLHPAFGSRCHSISFIQIAERGKLIHRTHLRYVDCRNEKLYSNHLEQLISSRLIVVGLISFVIFCLYDTPRWLVEALAFKNSKSDFFVDVKHAIILSLFDVLTLIMHAVLTFCGYIPVLRNNVEMTVIVTIGGSLAANFIQSFTEISAARTQADVGLLILLSGFRYILYFGILDFVFFVRIFYTCWLHLFSIICIIVIGTFSTIHVTYMESWTFYIILYWGTSTALCAAVICSFIACFLAELQNRMVFYNFWLTRNELSTVRETLEQERRGSTSALERLIQQVKDVHTLGSTLAMDADIPQHIKEMGLNLMEIYRKCMYVLTHGTNLYAVDVNMMPMEVWWVLSPEEKEDQAHRKASLTFVPSSRRNSMFSEYAVSLPISNNLGEQLIQPLDSDMERLVSQAGVSWDFDIFALKELYGSTLTVIGMHLLRNNIIEKHLKCSATVLYSFLYAIEQQYKENPYHNECHGAHVAHLTKIIIDKIQLFSGSTSPLEEAATIIAALGHDAGHPGRTNNYYVISSEYLALVYNDISVLENYHSYLVFYSLGRNDCNIFVSIPMSQYRRLRQRMIELILATDMAHHFSAISSFRVRHESPEFNYSTSEDDRWLCAKLCLKMADLGHTVAEWDQHYMWSLKLAEEFYLQGDEEARRGLSISPLCDRSRHGEMTKSQIGFIEFVVFPLAKEVSSLQINSAKEDDVMDRAKNNREKWILKLDNEDDEKSKFVPLLT